MQLIALFFLHKLASVDKKLLFWLLRRLLEGLFSYRFVWRFVIRYSRRWENHARKRAGVESGDDLY